MLSKHPTLKLAPEEIAYFDRLKSVGKGRAPKIPEKLLKRWRKLGMLELLPPPQKSSRRSAKPHLLIVEPHADDAVISAGINLLKKKALGWKITLLTVVRWSNYTSYPLTKATFDHPTLSVRSVTALRDFETRAAARLIGARFIQLGYSDLPLRCWEDMKKGGASRETANDLFPFWGTFGASPGEVKELSQKLGKVFARERPDEVWIPMGLGGHCDHRWTRDACWRAIERKSLHSSCKVIGYEDLPYGTRAPWHARSVARALESCGVRVTARSEDVSSRLPEKLRLLAAYKSQFKPEKLAISILARDGKLRENFWTLRNLTRLPRASEVDVEAAELAKLRRDLLKLPQKGRALSRVAVFSIVPLGRWQQGIKVLLGAFPRARIDIELAPSFRAEHPRSLPRHPRLRIRFRSSSDLVKTARKLRGESFAIVALGVNDADALRDGLGLRSGEHMIAAPSLGKLCLLLRELETTPGYR